MAGAIPIRPTEQEMALLARLQRDDMVRFLTELDEHGWSMARAVLRSLAERRNYPMNNKTRKHRGGWLSRRGMACQSGRDPLGTPTPDGADAAARPTRRTSRRADPGRPEAAPPLPAA
jgi:hypothetical protein